MMVDAGASFETLVPASPAVLADAAGPIVSAPAAAGDVAVFAEDFPPASVPAPGAKGFLTGSAVGDELVVCAGPGLSESAVDALLQPASATNTAATKKMVQGLAVYVSFMWKQNPELGRKANCEK